VLALSRQAPHNGQVPVVRPATLDDVPELAALLRLTGGEITTLQPDEGQLRRRISQSQAALQDEPERPEGEAYVFVLEHESRLLGTASVVSKTGGFEPFYCYEIRQERYTSQTLGIDKSVRSLHLVEDHSGPAEVGGLFLHPDIRGTGLGRLLSVSRFLFMAMRPHSFDAHVVAELRGKTRAPGESDFWDAIGRHFFEVPFAKADQSSFTEKKIIAELMPDHPIYIDMLPYAAQAVIGREHDDAVGARRVLEGEGFRFRDRVDIFDAGPALECSLDAIRAVDEGVVSPVRLTEHAADERAFLTASDHKSFRATLTTFGDGRLVIAEAERLRVRQGDLIRSMPLRPTNR
jgi:arginine N-succinyltransferase